MTIYYCSSCLIRVVKDRLRTAAEVLGAAGLDAEVAQPDHPAGVEDLEVRGARRNALDLGPR